LQTSTLGLTSSGVLGGNFGYATRWLSATTVGTSTLIDNGAVLGVNATSSSYTLNVQGSAGVNPFNVASSTGTSLLSVNQLGNVLIGTSSAFSLAKVQIDNQVSASGSASAIGGIYGNFVFNPSTQGTQVGNRFTIINAPTTASNTSIGEIIRTTDNTAFDNTVRGIEVVSSVGTNTNGINTGIRTTGGTFGIQAITTGLAGGLTVPAAIYGENTGTTQGDALRLYSSSVTTAAAMAKIYQEISAFSGTGLLMDLGANGGSFTGNFIDLRRNGTSQLTISNNGSLATTGNISATGTLNVIGNTTLINASATALTANTLYSTLANIINASTTGLTATNLYASNSSLGLASATAITTTGAAVIGGSLSVTGQTTLGNASTTNTSVSSNFYVNGSSTLASTTVTNLFVSGQGSFGNASATALTANTLYSTLANIINASTTGVTASTVYSSAINLSGALRDSTNASGTLGQILLSTGTSTIWTSTSSLAITSAGVTGGAIGYATRWLTATTLGTSTLIDNGTVLGINATSSNFAFNVQSSTSSALNPFNVASSTGASLFTILSNGNVGIGSSTPAYLLGVAGTFGVSGQTRLTTASATSITISGQTYANNLSATNSTTTNTVTTYLTANSSIVGTSSVTGTLGVNGTSTLSTTTATRLTVSEGLGVGSATPGSLLTVQGIAGAANPLLNVASSSGASFLSVLPNGNIGIGTTTQSQSLVVDKSTGVASFGLYGASADITASAGSAGGAGLAINGSSGSGSFLDFKASGTTVNSIFTGQTNTNLIFSNNKGGAATVNTAYISNSNDNRNGTMVLFNGLTVGTSSLPTAQLSVWGADNLASTRAFDVTNAASATMFTVYNDGKVAIGATTTPGYLLSVAGTFGVSGQTTLTTASATGITANDIFTPNLSLSGTLRDVNNASGTLGMILQTTGTSTQWVSTSSLGIIASDVDKGEKIMVELGEGEVRAEIF
jgi:hypothetical protein